MSDLNALLDMPDAEGWRPEPGDKLIGKVVERTTREGAYGPYPLLVILPDGDPDQLVAVHGYHTVLRQEIEEKDPQEGDRVGIAYKGKPEGKDYELYKVLVERAAGTRPAPAPAPAPSPAPSASPSNDDLFDDEPF